MLMLLLAAATPQTAVEAERAFAADAQTLGQWTAFRKWAAPDAVMFVPQPTNAQAWLKDRHDPEHVVAWTPTASYQSCDGRVAVNTGEWRLPGGVTGFFSTVWVRQADGSWRWAVDGGDSLTPPRARVEQPLIRRAACSRVRLRLGAPIGVDAEVDRRESPDGTLEWRWEVAASGERTFQVHLWNGARMEPVISDHIAPPPPPAVP